MQITIFGAAGDVGSRIVAEALSRGHDVTAVVRRAAGVNRLPPAVRVITADAADPVQVVRQCAGQDLVISAVRPPDGQEQQLVTVTRSILKGAAATGVRVLIVGGAASLKLPGQGDVTVLTADDFLPDSVLGIARACQAQYEACLAEVEADWSYLSPPAMLVPGERTGSYRLGRDELLVDADGQSGISMEDFAVVLLDEAEQPRHQRMRFTAAA
jgi:uncharacterized protein